MSAPTRARFSRLQSLARVVIECLDLSEIPPAARAKIGPYAAMALYEILSKIELPAFDDIPDADQLKALLASLAGGPRATADPDLPDRREP